MLAGYAILGLSSFIQNTYNHQQLYNHVVAENSVKYVPPDGFFGI